MGPEDFEDLYKLEETFWWFVAMRHLTDTVMGEELRRPGLRVLDAGCGTGYNLRHYTTQGHRVFGFDIAAEAIDAVRQRGFREVCRASVVEIPYVTGSFDLVFSFEVVDQLDPAGAEQAIRELYRVLKPGGSLFIRLPALEWMRSSHDDDIATAHRYTRTEVVGLLRRAGFQTAFASYANTLLFPIVLLRRAVKRLGVGRGSDVKPLPAVLGWVDPLFRNILAVEARRFKAGKTFPLGLSVICRAVK